uniref:C-type lectin domain-containing protein n=1 Tax=Equus asinus asinus TaxID=83772 RepID=A0A8C4M8I4_EQUAS
MKIEFNVQNICSFTGCTGCNHGVRFPSPIHNSQPYIRVIENFEKHKSSTEHMSCLDGWIGYLGKCFYFSENTTWAASQNFCASYAATLAVFNTTKELDFLKRYSDHSQYWVGLSRKPGQTWKWIDGTTFKIIGIGECAYLHKIGISSASTHLVRKWICSKPDTHISGS